VGLIFYFEPTRHKQRFTKRQLIEMLDQRNANQAE